MNTERIAPLRYLCFLLSTLGLPGTNQRSQADRRNIPADSSRSQFRVTQGSRKSQLRLSFSVPSVASCARLRNVRLPLAVCVARRWAVPSRASTAPKVAWAEWGLGNTHNPVKCRRFERRCFHRGTVRRHPGIPLRRRKTISQSRSISPRSITSMGFSPSKASLGATNQPPSESGSTTSLKASHNR